jgi:hypothetical protein
MRLSAIDSLQRGVLVAWANWELAVVQLIQNLTVGLLVVLGALPPLLVLGFKDFGSWVQAEKADPGAIEDVLSELAARLSEAWAPLLLSLLATLIVWFVATLVFCFFQAGMLGTLMAAEDRAPAGPSVRATELRVFSWRGFAEAGQRLLWRLFWFWNLYLGIATGVLALFCFVVLAAVVVGTDGHPAAGFAVGCLGAMPLLAAFVALALWYSVAYADLGRDGSSVRIASTMGLRILRQRLGGVLLLALVMFAATMGVGLFFGGIGFVLQLALIAVPPVAFSLSLLMTAVQWAVSGWITVGWTAAAVALVRGERDAASPVAAPPLAPAMLAPALPPPVWAAEPSASAEPGEEPPVA